MELCGLQKLTLLDFPERMACTVFTAGCNMRCPFCHNASLVTRAAEQPRMPLETFMAFLDKRKGILEGVCVTGGEPTLQPDLPQFLAAIREKGYLVKLDTNGARPDVLAAVLDGGLVDYVAMDIKAGRANYAAAVGVKDFDIAPVEKSVALLAQGRVPCEFRTTVVKGIHTAADFDDIAAWLPADIPYYLQSFVDSGDLIAAGDAFTKEEMESFRARVLPSLPKTALRGQ